MSDVKNGWYWNFSAVLWTGRDSEIAGKDHIGLFAFQGLHHKWKALTGDFEGRNEPCNYGESWVCLSK